MSFKNYLFLFLAVVWPCYPTPQASEIALLNNAQFNWVYDTSKWETFLDKVADKKQRAKFAETLSKQEIANPSLSPLGGAVAWYSELIRGLYLYGPYIKPIWTAPNAKAFTDEQNKTKHPLITLVRYLFHAPGENTNVEISKAEDSIVTILINKGEWPYLMQLFFSTISEADFKNLCKKVIEHCGIKSLRYFTTTLNNAREYWKKPDAERDLPKETVELVLSAVWYAAIDKLDGRPDIVIDRTASQSVEMVIKNLHASKNRNTAKKIFSESLISQSDSGKLTLLVYNRANHGYPPYVEQKYYNCASIAVKDVPDCVESTLHNIIDVLAYDPETQLYNPAIYLPNDARIADYFNKQLDGKSFSIPEVSVSHAACQSWFNQMEKIPNAHYTGADRQNICELDGDTDNILTALKYLLIPTDLTNANSSYIAKKIQAANSLKDLGTALSNNNQTITFEGIGSNYVMTIQKNNGDHKTELVVHLLFNKGHA